MSIDWKEILRNLANSNESCDSLIQLLDGHENDTDDFYKKIINKFQKYLEAYNNNECTKEEFCILVRTLFTWQQSHELGAIADQKIKRQAFQQKALAVIEKVLSFIL